MASLRGAAQVFLAALIVQQVASLMERLNASSTGDLKGNLRDGYTTAYTAGALWSLLNLVGASAPHPSQLPAGINLTKRLEILSGRAGLEFALTRTEPRDALERQTKIATGRLEEYRQLTQGQPSAAESRAGVYAVRWGVQQGAGDVGRYSSAVGPDGEPVELLKTWLRLSRRVEHRGWHDALEGKIIPYSEKFKLVGPNGTFLVDRPYDPILPLSETIRCGHGIRADTPDGATVTPWDGS
jgi:hypothetical protein